MVDVTKVDTSFELFGKTYDHPILLGPGGGKNIVIADGEKLSAQAARQSKAIMVGGQGPMLAEMGKAGQAPTWWAATLGEGTQAQAVEFAKRGEDNGASALCITVDYAYTGARDRPSRDQWDPEWARTRVYGTPEFRVGFQAGMIDPYTPNLTWEWMKWVRPQTKLPRRRHQRLGPGRSGTSGLSLRLPAGRARRSMVFLPSCESQFSYARRKMRVGVGTDM